MNRKVVGVVIIIVVIGILYATMTIGDDFSESSDHESTEVSDHITLEKNIELPEFNNPNYVIDENGNKRYGIVAVDSPDLGD